MSDTASTPVAIVGMGALFPGAPDAAAYWRNITDGVDAITDVPADRWDPGYYDPAAWDEPATADRIYVRRGGFVDDAAATFEPTRFGVMPVAVEGAEPDQLLALRVAAEAIDDAGGPDRLPAPDRVGVILGRGGYLTPGLVRLDQRVRTAHQLTSVLADLIPGLDEARLAEVRRAFQERLGPERPDAAIGLVPNLAASRIANRLDLRGPAYTVDAACASSLVAVDHAVRELASGRCDAVLAGGVHHCHDVTLWSVFSQLRALSPSQRISPFSRQADGLLIGEGTGVVMLKRLADAERDGDRVYAVVTGTGVAGDGRAGSLMAPESGGQVLAVRRAWTAAGVDPAADGAVGLIEAHGTATRAGDTAELATLDAVFGRDGAPVGLGSVKSMIGHTMPAAGIAGLIKAAYAVHHGVMPPTLHCEDPHQDLKESRFRPITATEPWETDGPRRAGVNAFGFGGINAHVVLEQAPNSVARPGPARRAASEAAQPAERVLRLSAATRDGLLRLLERDDLENGGEYGDGGPWRLALVGPTRRGVELARKVAARGRPWRNRNDLWFTGAPLLGAGGGKVAFVFPGIEATFTPNVADVAEHFGLTAPAIDPSPALYAQALGVTAVGRLLDAALRDIGVAPDLTAGHSVGEWTAMIASGMYPRDAVDAFIEGLDGASFELPGVVFAALGCGADVAVRAIAEVGGEITVSHDNCPHQSIVCGDEAAVAELVRLLGTRGVLGQVLPFRSGFHSPMLAPYVAPMHEAADRLPLRPPTVPVWSATTVQPYPRADDEVRELVFRHLVEPVRFRSLAENLYASGVRAFVQMGVGSVVGFLDDTLQGRDSLTISANSPKQSGLGQLRRVAAALWTEGLEPRFDRLDPVGPVAAPPKAAKPMRLSLGGALIRLDSVPPLLPAATVGAARQVPAAASAASPVLAEFQAVLDAASVNAGSVLDAWQSAYVRAPNARPRAEEPRSEPPPREPVDGTRTFSVENMPYLMDHCFYRQPAGWPTPADRFPVVPMTTLLELMAEAATGLTPGTVAVGFEDVRALRWLAAAPATATAIAPVRLAPDRVKVTIDGYTYGTVLLADAYPAPPAPSPEPLIGAEASDITARQMYDDRWMFHGPAFQGVTTLGPSAANGIGGEITTPAAPGALLDNAGQLMGYWLMRQAAVNRLAFPSTIRRITFHGPAPRAGDRLACSVWIRQVTDAVLRADMELRDTRGTVWCLIEGWEDRRFSTDEITWPVLVDPETECVAEEQHDGWFLVRERWDAAMRELMMRRYLTTGERAEYESYDPRTKRQWLLGRMAVKDAVRHHLWHAGAGPIFPIEITVTTGAAGRPTAHGPHGERVDVSYAHTTWLGAAVVGPDPDAASRHLAAHQTAHPDAHV